VRRNKILGELVTFKNTQGLHLDGILYQKDTHKITIIHIHGSLGNFYQNQFLRLMAKMYQDNGINFLSFNLSAHDGLAEGFRNDEFEYIGGTIVDFNECINDIEGALEFVKPFSERIILQGHSLGCDRTLHFLLNHSDKYDFILLSPCDSYQLQVKRVAPETVQEQIKRLKKEGNLDVFQLLPPNEYGVSQNDEVYDIPITKKALLSIMEGPPYKLIRLGVQKKYFIDSKCLIYLGGQDPLQTAHRNDMFHYFKERVKEVTEVYIPEGDHDLSNCEKDVIKNIITWQNSLEL